MRDPAMRDPARNTPAAQYARHVKSVKTLKNVKWGNAVETRKVAMPAQSISDAGGYGGGSWGGVGGSSFGGGRGGGGGCH